jgi:hypothetical protein
MNTKRDRELSYEEMDFVFVEDFYDLPLRGLCKWYGELCHFELRDYDDEIPVYYIRRLTGYEKFIRLTHKKVFEICVGTHWTGDYKKHRFKIRKPRWFWEIISNIYYWRW